MESALFLGQARPCPSPRPKGRRHRSFWPLDHWHNLDPTIFSVGPDSRVPDRRIFVKFPRSQHRSSLIVPPRLALPVPSKPVKRWNFSKANCSDYNAWTNNPAKSLLPPDVDLAYQDFCNVIRIVAKNSIPSSRGNNHIPC